MPMPSVSWLRRQLSGHDDLRLGNAPRSGYPPLSIAAMPPVARLGKAD
jgi:hypothetical protein